MAYVSWTEISSRLEKIEANLSAPSKRIPNFESGTTVGTGPANALKAQTNPDGISSVSVYKNEYRIIGKIAYIELTFTLDTTHTSAGQAAGELTIALPSELHIGLSLVGEELSIEGDIQMKCVIYQDKLVITDGTGNTAIQIMNEDEIVPRLFTIFGEYLLP